MGEKMKRIIEKIKRREITVCVIGLGYVGYPLLKVISERNFPVIGFDINREKVRKAVKEGYQATIDPKEALENRDCIIVCVPTPVDKNYHPDLSYIINACENIRKYLKKDSLVIIESTIAPGTTEEIILPILEKSGLKAGRDFYLAHCPERIDPGNKEWTIQNIPRVVGGINEKSTEISYHFYRSILKAEVHKVSSAKVAEAIKIVENAFRDINIAFVNELAKSFDRIGIDILEVIRGAATKPFGFMPHYPGCGVGGHCIPVDPYYLIEKAEEFGFSHNFLKLAREINNSMPEYTINKLIKALNQLESCVKKAKIAVLGVAYKGGVDDVRESPALKIIEKLKEMGAILFVYDPYLPHFSSVGSLEEALKEADYVLIATDHPEFKNLSAELFKKYGIKAVIDGRNILDKEKIIKAGILYEGIGR